MTDMPDTLYISSAAMSMSRMVRMVWLCVIIYADTSRWLSLTHARRDCSLSPSHWEH